MIAKPFPPAAAAEGWFTPGRFALLLGGLIVATFPGIIFGQETFFYRDFGIFGYPLAHYQRECFWRGELPLWNPYSECGLPFLAEWNTLTLYPPAIFYLVFPLSWSLGVFNLGHLFLAGMGMYFLARQWTNHRLAAAAAGLIFAFNGFSWHALMWPNDIAGWGWMPWVVWTVEKGWRQGGRSVAWAALAGGMQMLTGAPEIILLTWSLLGLLWLAQLCGNADLRPQKFLRFGGIAALVAGLAAAQLLPFLQLLAHSQRDAGYHDAADWAMPLAGLANFIAPLFHCFPAAQGVFMQHDQGWIASYFTGEGALMLAILIVLTGRKRRLWLLVVAAIFCVWLALGKAGHLYSLIHAVAPLIGFMRYPIKFVVVAVFIIPLLAAYGLKRLTSAEADQTTTTKFIAGIALLVLALLAASAWREWRHPDNGDVWLPIWHNILVRAAFVIVFAGLFIALPRARSLKSAVFLSVAILLLLWADILTHAPNLSPTVPRSVYEEGLVRADLKLPPASNVGEPRFLASEVSLEHLHFGSITNAANDYLCRRLALFDDCNLLEDLPKVDGFYSLDLKEMSEVVSLLYGADEKGIDLRGLKDFLGIQRVNPPGTNEQNALDWLARPHGQPLVTAGQMPVFASATDSLRLLFNPDFNPQEMVSLPPEVKGDVHATRTKVTLSDLRLAAERLSLTAEADAPALVVVAQGFYQPWRAYVDGRRVELWRANHAFQALQIEAGKHRVELIYEDVMFKVGAVISFISILICGLLFYRTGRRA